jgi:hypothetical protein
VTGRQETSLTPQQLIQFIQPAHYAQHTLLERAVFTYTLQERHGKVLEEA